MNSEFWSEIVRAGWGRGRLAAGLVTGVLTTVGLLLGGCSDPVTVTGVQHRRPYVEELASLAQPELGLDAVDPQLPDVVTDALAVHFVQQPGFHAGPFSLEIHGADPTAEIFYTLDGSLPDVSAVDDSSGLPDPNLVRRRTHRYLGPVDLAPWVSRPNQLSAIDTSTAKGERGYRKWHPPAGHVAKSVVVRAQAIAGNRVSPVISGTYFIDPKGRQRYSLPVVSLSTEPAYLFGQRPGIYVRWEEPTEPNFEQRGDEWERPAYFELFSLPGERSIGQWSGLRIHGDYSRAFPQKSLRLYARKEYGASTFSHAFFPTKPHAEFKRLLLRNGGNDWDRALFRDAAMQSLVHHLPMDTQHVQPVVVFINGEYWGLHEIRDRLDRFHIEHHHGVPRDRVTIIQNGSKLAEGSRDDLEAFREFLDALVAGELGNWQSIDAFVAVPEFLDYLVVEVFAGNTDWPNKNIGWWRFSGPFDRETRGPRDGRWRPMLYDVDRSLGNFDSTTANVVQRAFGEEATRGASPFVRGLMGVKQLRHEFIQRMAVHLETTFQTQRVRAAVEHFTRVIEREMPEQIARWGYPDSMDTFYSHVEDAHEFAEVRSDNVRRHVVSFFDEVSGMARVRIENLDSSRPPVLHGVPLSPATPGVRLKDGSWEATVFAGVPLVLASEDYHTDDIFVEGASARRAAGRLELTLEPNSIATVRLPPLPEGNQGT